MSLESAQIEISNESENETDELTFHNACVVGNLDVVKIYLAQPEFDMNIGDDDGCTGFHEACREGSLEVIQLLLQEGFDINIRDHVGRTGFHEACDYGELNVVQFLLQEGFDINIRDHEGTTGFHEACGNGSLEVVELLLQEGFDMNVGDNEESTGFYHACRYGRLNVVQFLLEQGFQGIHEIGVGGKTGLEMLFDNYNQRNDHNALDWMYDFDEELFIPCVLCLIESGAQVNENYVFEELIYAIKIRIIEIIGVKKTIF